MVATDFKDDARVKALFLVDRDEARMRQAIFSRGLWGDADTYGDHLKEKEVEWASLYSQRLEAEARKYNYPWVEVHKNDDDLPRVLAALAAK
jgi:hypothetical protein